MIVEIIAVGTEILLGNIVNTNAAYLAGECAYLGLSCYYQSVVGDNEARLLESIRTALSRADIILLSGGLGPTQDDLTKETAAKAFSMELRMDEDIREELEEFFKKRSLPMTENNYKQALVPMGAKIVKNPNGTAPGLILTQEGKHMILMPGPPGELKPMFQESIIPYLKELTGGTIYSRTVKICGVGESKAEDMIRDLIESQSNPTIAPYAKTGEVHLRITARAEEEKEAKKLVKPLVRELKARFGSHVYSTEEEVTLEKAVVDLLMENRLTLTCAESCTGGLLAGRLTDVPGVSDVFKAGCITYSNKAKRKLLGVKKSTLEKYGAVSSQVAGEMAKGAASHMKADVSVSVTGIAGPGGGSDQKPVGLVYVACYIMGKVVVKEYQFSGNRTKIRESTVAAALVLMRKCILEYFQEITFGKKANI